MQAHGVGSWWALASVALALGVVLAQGLTQTGWLAIVAVTAFGFLQRIFSTVALSFSQWWICIGIAASLVLVEELIKVFIRRRARRSAPAEARAARVA
jgi:hypothetical protein